MMIAFQSFSRYSLPIENYQFLPISFDIPEADSNEPYEPDEDDIVISDIYYYAFEIVAMVLVTFGIISNIANVIALAKPNLKGVMYVYLLALAATNLSSLALAIPTLLQLAKPFETSTYSSFGLAVFVAHIEIPLLNIFIGTSTFIVIFSTINLFIAVYKPTCFRDIYTYKNAYRQITISFILNFFLVLPHIFLSYFHEVCLDEDNEDLYCPTNQHGRTIIHEDIVKFNETQENVDNVSECSNIGYIVCVNKHYDIGLKIYTYITSFLLRLGPIVFVTIVTILIVWRFNKLVRRRRETTTVQDSTDSVTGDEALYTQEEKMMVAVIVAIAVVFVVCNTPAAVLTIMFTKKQETFSESVHHAVFRSIANNLELLGLCLNLVIYCLCSGTVRKAYVDVFCRNRLVTKVRNYLNDRNLTSTGAIRGSNSSST